MNASRSIAALGALTLLLAGSVAAQEAERDTTRLQPLVITATKVPVAQAAPVSSTTILEGEALRARGIVSLADALREVPGVTVAPSGSFGGTTSLFVRGGERDYVRVLVDGVPVNQPGGEVDLASITMDNVERVEVVRGPVSVLYGSDAMTGVVQIFTRKGGGPTELNAAARGGTFNTREADVSAAGGRQSFAWSVGGGMRRTDGIFPFNSEYRNDVLSGSVSTAGARHDARFTGRFADGRFNYPTDFTGAPVDSNAHRTERHLVFGVDAGYRFGNRVEARALLGATEMDLRNDDRPDGGNTSGYISRNEIARRIAELRTNVHLADRTVLSAGFEYSQQRDRNASASIFDGETFAVPQQTPRRFNRALHAQLTGDVGNRASYTLGTRFDRNANFGEFFTYRAAAGVRALEATWIRIAYGAAFKEPTILENYGGGFVTGNPDLDPERSRSWEVGVEQQLLGGALALEATWFDQDFRDRIEFVTVDEESTYANLARATSEGLELTARVFPAAPLSVTGSFTAMRTRAIATGDATSQRLLRRPAAIATVTADYRPVHALRLGATVNRVGARDDMDFAAWPAERVELGSYVRADVYGEVALRQRPGAYGVSFTARVENVLDEEYQSVYGFRTPGRTVLAGLRFALRP